MTKKGPFPGGSHIHIGPAELDLPSRAYALNLASQLGIPAHIYMSGTQNEGRPINEEERVRIRHHVSGAHINTRAPKGRGDGFSIVITSALSPEQNTLDPKHNSAFDEHNQRRILVPLGQHTSGLRALDAALRIALATINLYFSCSEDMIMDNLLCSIGCFNLHTKARVTDKKGLEKN